MSTGTRRRVGLIGLGVMGSIYRRRLLQHDRHELVTVDPRPAAGGAHTSLADALDLTSGCDLWVVAAPTSAHVGLVKQILGRNASARILVEKPVGNVSDMLSLVALLRDRYTRARVRVSDLYGRGALANILRTSIDTLPGAITRTDIVMVKNRMADEAAGRFVCTDFGDYGYEWFHVLRLLELGAPTGLFGRALEGTGVDASLDAGRWTWRAGGVTMTASARTDGVVAIPELGWDRSRALEPHERFRRMRVTTEEATLEANLDSAVRAIIRVKRRGGMSAVTITLDRADAVVEAVDAMFDDTWDRTPEVSLELAQHMMLARLRRAGERLQQDGVMSVA